MQRALRAVTASAAMSRVALQNRPKAAAPFHCVALFPLMVLLVAAMTGPNRFLVAAVILVVSSWGVMVKS
jgi:hypothetical protein